MPTIKKKNFKPPHFTSQGTRKKKKKPKLSKRKGKGQHGKGNRDQKNNRKNIKK